MSLLKPSPHAIPVFITFKIQYKAANGEIQEKEVTVRARNLVEGLAKALNAAHVYLEDVVKAEVVGAEL